MCFSYKPLWKLSIDQEMIKKSAHIERRGLRRSPSFPSSWGFALSLVNFFATVQSLARQFSVWHRVKCFLSRRYICCKGIHPFRISWMFAFWDRVPSVDIESGATLTYLFSFGVLSVAKEWVKKLQAARLARICQVWRPRPFLLPHPSDRQRQDDGERSPLWTARSIASNNDCRCDTVHGLHGRQPPISPHNCSKTGGTVFFMSLGGGNMSFRSVSIDPVLPGRDTFVQNHRLAFRYRYQLDSLRQ